MGSFVKNRPIIQTKCVNDHEYELATETDGGFTPRPLNTLKIGIVAGELSGDQLGAAFILALKRHIPNLTIIGIGGPKLIAAGMQVRHPIDKLSVMGLIEPLKHLPELLSIRRDLYRYFVAEKIDVFIGIDSPDFNLDLEIKLKETGIKVIHYVSPSVWAWRRWRCRKIARAVDLMLVLFPFEEAFYHSYQIPARYVGHPLADTIPLTSDKSLARRNLNLTENVKILALLPGSRLGELKQLAALFIKTAAACCQQDSTLTVVVALANEKCEKYFRQVYAKTAINLPITFIQQQTLTVMAAADTVLLASGTATLECTLIKRPMVVSYRVSALTALIVKRLLTVSFFSLPNLLLNKPLVKEFIQKHATVSNLTAAVMEMLTSDPTLLIAEFTALHQQLRCDAANRAADALLQLLAPPK